MRVELFPFQKKAVSDLRIKVSEALGCYSRTHTPQVVSLQAPTGAGKTIIMAALIENIFFGSDTFIDQPEAIFVWLSDSPALNVQSKDKIDLKADRVRWGQCVIIDDKSVDREMLEDGQIYFLNTQKIGKSGNLTRHSDSRQYTIWETLANTVKNKSDRLYFIIDEAHRGTQGKEAGTATSIMQRFIKGKPELDLPPMPLVIGISATAARFNALVGNTTSTLQKCIISANEVRASGLLKDRIVITYPEDPRKSNDLAVLAAAVDEWKSKCDHWNQYCTEQHYAQVKPILVIQALAGSGDNVSDTDLESVLQTIENRLGTQFKEHEVVHTFGSASALKINGLTIPHVSQADITDDKRIRVVLFKENLSTGWDCPRAETMMSFRKAEDATYIAQLLGRMVRTPLQCHIQVDETLNDVRLFLPYFNMDTVKQVIDELQNTECGEIPAVIDDEPLGVPRYTPWSVRPGHRNPNVDHPGQLHLPFPPEESNSTPTANAGEDLNEIRPQQEPTVLVPAKPQRAPSPKPPVLPTPTLPFLSIDREGIVKFINQQGFLTYQVRSLKINSYLDSMLNLSSILTQTGIYAQANREITAEVVKMMRDYIDQLHRTRQYDNLAQQVLSFKLSVKIFDVFGEDLHREKTQNLFTVSESDLDRQFRAADAKLGGFGFPNRYGEKYYRDEEPISDQIDCILFAADDACLDKLNRYAKDKFHLWDDKYRKYVVNQSDQYKKRYHEIIADGDAVSKHNFSLPETISGRTDPNGKEYTDHLYADENGTAKIKLNGWEEGVLMEESESMDFVCWLRNPPRGSWSLTLPYEINGEIKAMYPDFIVIRRDPGLGYVLDILEPHSPDYKDNLAKAKGLAQYAIEEPRMGRIELIRQCKDEAGKKRFKRLDFAKGLIREKVLKATNNEELDHLFDEQAEFWSF